MTNQLAVMHSIPDLERMAVALAGSRLFGVMTPEQAFALMLIAQADGVHPATVAREYDIIQGRPALKSQAALARFQAAGGRIQWIERGPTVCSAEFSHAAGGTLTIRWDIARAQAAQLTGKDNWKKFPDQMLSARVVAEGVRAVFPACLNGVYLAEEVQDFDPPRPRPSGVEVSHDPAPPIPASKPKAKIITRAKAEDLVTRAREAGFSDESIASAIGTDLDAVKASDAVAFFELVKGEEIAYAERMAAGQDEDAQGVPEQE